MPYKQDIDMYLYEIKPFEDLLWSVRRWIELQSTLIGFHVLARPKHTNKQNCFGMFYYGTKTNICLVSYVFVYLVGVTELFKFTSRIYSVYLTNLMLSWGN